MREEDTGTRGRGDTENINKILSASPTPSVTASSILKAPIVISNASIWDTYTQLLRPDDLPASERQAALATPSVDSFMHLHLGIRADG